MAKKIICFPFVKRGGFEYMCEYVGFDLDETQISECCSIGKISVEKSNNVFIWKKQQILNTTLTFEGYCKGRSSATFYWRDISGNKYPMFLTDLGKLIETNKIARVISGNFEFVKRGRNYGIKMCDEEC